MDAKWLGQDQVVDFAHQSQQQAANQVRHPDVLWGYHLDTPTRRLLAGSRLVRDKPDILAKHCLAGPVGGDDISTLLPGIM